MKKQKQNYLFQILTLIFLSVFTLTADVPAQTLPGAPPAFLWAESGGSDGYDGATDLAVDIDGNIVVTGYYDGIATFGSYTLNPSGAGDIYIAKYSNTGTVLWAVSAGGTSYDQPYSVTTDNLGNVIVTGIFNGVAIFGTTTLNSFGGYDIFTAKYNSDGIFQWVRQGGGQSYDYGYEVTADNQNNIIVTGTYTQFATFGPFTVQSGNPYGDIYVVKYDQSGTEQWVRTAINATGGQSFYNLSYGVRTDNNDNVFITGSFSNVITFGDSTSIRDTTLVSSWDGTDQDIFLAKYDALGNFNWALQVISDSSNSYSYGRDIRIDKDNNIVFTGSFSVMANFGSYVLYGLESSDIFIAKCDQNGLVSWAVQDNPSSYYNDAKEIDLDAAGNICLIASVSQDLTAGELDDIYFARYSNTGLKLWGTRAGLLNSSDAGGIANDSRGDIYGCGRFYLNGQFGTLTLTGLNDDAFVVKLPSPKFIVTPNPVDFGTIPVVNLDSMTVSINNSSQANLHIFDMNFVNDTSEAFGIISGYTVDSVTALQSADMEFIFVPIYPGLKTAYMEIISDATTSPDTVFFSGTGTQSELVFSDSVLNFGSIDVGLVSNQTVSLINPGFADMLIDSARITGINASSFSFSPPVDGDTLHILGFLNLNVSFSPDTSGLKNASLVVYSSALNNPDSILLRGTGLSSIVVQVPTPPGVGQSVNLNITPPALTQYLSSNIYYRKTGDLGFQQDTLSNTGNNYTFNIPPAFSTVTGIQFYVEFNDGLSITTYPSLNPDTNPASIQVTVPQMNFPDTVRQGNYQMFTVPLAINSPQLDSVFQDDYGPYDPAAWRIFRWDPELGEYTEHNSISGGVVPGSAFWLINKDGKTFDMDNSLSVPSFNNYTVTIEPGYNQVGNPFAFPVDWLSIENSNLVLQAPLRWNPDTQEYELDQLIVEPWEGYWVYNPLSTIISLNVNPNVSLGKKQNSDLFTSEKDDEFLVQIKAFLNSSGEKDQMNYVSMKEGAKDGLDKFDVIKPPAIKDDIKVLLEHGKNYFARNAVPVSKDGAFWDFTVETREAGQVFNLALDRLSALPENFNIWMLDRDREIPLDMSSGTVEAAAGGNGKSHFRIIIGTEDFAKINSENISLQPYEYALYQNYPNPFNPSTVITYQLKQKENVTLEIFDILGSRIKSLVNNVAENPGQHTVTWNGLNSNGEKVASGIYIYRLRAKDFVSSKKMILLK